MHLWYLFPLFLWKGNLVWHIYVAGAEKSSSPCNGTPIADTPEYIDGQNGAWLAWSKF